MTTPSSSPVQEPQEALGIVVNAQFISADTRKPIEVTEAQLQEAVDPRAKLVDLSKYEGKAILIRCQTNDGSFLWGSNVVSTAGPILTAIFKKVYDLK
jgi:hypothetical protein